jgi:hypothetical protein
LQEFHEQVSSFRASKKTIVSSPRRVISLWRTEHQRSSIAFSKSNILFEWRMILQQFEVTTIGRYINYVSALGSVILLSALKQLQGSFSP